VSKVVPSKSRLVLQQRQRPGAVDDEVGLVGDRGTLALGAKSRDPTAAGLDHVVDHGVVVELDPGVLRPLR